MQSTELTLTWTMELNGLWTVADLGKQRCPRTLEHQTSGCSDAKNIWTCNFAVMIWKIICVNELFPLELFSFFRIRMHDACSTTRVRTLKEKAFNESLLWASGALAKVLWPFIFSLTFSGLPQNLRNSFFLKVMVMKLLLWCVAAKKPMNDLWTLLCSWLSFGIVREVT